MLAIAIPSAKRLYAIWDVTTHSKINAPHIVPHLSNQYTPEQWAYAHYHAQIDVYQFGCEHGVRPNMTKEKKEENHVK